MQCKANYDYNQNVTPAKDSGLYLAILCIFDFSQKSEKFFEFIAKKREKCEKILKDIFTLNAFK